MPVRVSVVRAITVALTVCLVAVAAPASQAVPVELLEEWDPVGGVSRPVARWVEQGLVHRVVLPRIVRAADSVHSYGLDQIAVIGRSSAGKTITVLSRTIGAVRDEFLAYSPAVSPTSRYIAFERFWQPSASELAAVVSIYDLAQTAQANRLGVTAGLETQRFAGFPVFPPDHRGIAYYKDVPAAPDSPRPITKLYWIDTETVAFIAYSPGTSRLVTLRAAPDFDGPQQQSYDLDPALAINQQALGAGDDAALQFSGSELEFDPAMNRITVRLPEGSQYRVRTLSISR
jgi:hypothetical protein